MAPRNTLHDPTTYRFLLPSKIEQIKSTRKCNKKKNKHRRQLSQNWIMFCNNYVLHFVVRCWKTVRSVLNIRLLEAFPWLHRAQSAQLNRDHRSRSGSSVEPAKRFRYVASRKPPMIKNFHRDPPVILIDRFSGCHFSVVWFKSRKNGGVRCTSVNFFLWR